MSETGDAEATGALTVDEAAAAILALDPEEGIQGEEEQGDEAPAEEDADEAASEEQSDEDEDQDEGDGEQPTLIPVKIDGKTEKVTLDELKAGYSRQADYTRKTMEHAENVKAFETDKTSTLAERERYKAVVEYWEKQISQPLYDPAETEALRSIDPAEWAARNAEERDRQAQAQALKDELLGLSKKADHETVEAKKAAISQAEKALLDAVPEWKADPKKYQAGLKSVFDYAETVGFTRGDVLANPDHRTLLVLKDAAAYRAIVSKKPDTVAKVGAVKVAQPGSPAAIPTKRTAATRAQATLAKSGSVQDAAAAFMHLAPD